MDKRQIDILLIRKLPHGGYTVSDRARFEDGRAELMLFAGDLDEVLSYTRDALTFDDRCKSDAASNVA